MLAGEPPRTVPFEGHCQRRIESPLLPTPIVESALLLELTKFLRLKNLHARHSSNRCSLSAYTHIVILYLLDCQIKQSSSLNNQKYIWWLLLIVSINTTIYITILSTMCWILYWVFHIRALLILAIQERAYYSHFTCGETEIRSLCNLHSLPKHIPSPWYKTLLLVSSFWCNFTLTHPHLMGPLASRLWYYP